MGVATVLGSARGAAALMRDPQGTVTRYLSTHTPAEIALDLATAALTTVGAGAASAMGGQIARGAHAATREAEYAAWLWRTDRAAWRQYVRNARRLARDETGTASAGMWHPRNGIHYPGLRTPRPGRSEGGPGLWGKGKNYGSARSQLYEEQVTGVPIEHSYYVGGKEFDGYDGFSLVDAKGPGYAFRIKSDWSDEPFTTPERYSETKGKIIKEKKGLIDIGKEQVEAVRSTGTDTPIQWHIAEKETFDELWDRQMDNDFPPEIELIYTPPK